MGKINVSRFRPQKLIKELIFLFDLIFDYVPSKRIAEQMTRVNGEYERVHGTPHVVAGRTKWMKPAQVIQRERKLVPI